MGKQKRRLTAASPLQENNTVSTEDQNPTSSAAVDQQIAALPETDTPPPSDTQSDAAQVEIEPAVEVVAPAPTAAPAPPPTPAPTPAPTAAPSAPVARQVLDPVTVQDATPASAAVHPFDVVAALPQGLSHMAVHALELVREYIPAVRPKMPITRAELLRQQTNLWRAISTVINKLEGDDFAIAWRWLLAQFHAHRDGVFGELHLFRGFQHIAMSDGERRAFQRVLNLLKLTADPLSRKIALKQIDVTKALELGVTEPGRQRVLAFFGL